jgi:hypothetical protein
MRRPLLALALLLAGCAKVPLPPPLETPDPAPLPPSAAWLVGVWLPDATSDDLDRGACASGQPIQYRADGLSLFWEGDARWRLQNGVLIETIVRANEDIIDAKELGVGTTGRTRLWRIGPNEAAWRRGGKWYRMLRCPPAL